MRRIEKVDPRTAPQQTKSLLSDVRAQMGATPNLILTMAHSPAALGGYLGLAGALSKGALDPKLREQVAVAVAGANACDYCASAHTLLGQNAGVDRDELNRSLAGVSSESKTASALLFVVKIVRERGHILDADLVAIRAAGFSEEEIAEMVAHTAMNIFTNYFNHIARTDIDFPLVETKRAAA